MVKLMNILPRAALLVLASISSVVNADLVITQPSSDIWWVAKSQNVIAWTCRDTSIVDFTILVNNADPKLAVAPLAVIAIQQNFQCSIVITQDQANQPAGTGWTILFADPLNNTNVYATSQPFEIKPLGSAYPSQVTPTANGTAAGVSATDGSNTAKPTSASAPSFALGGKGLFSGVAMGLVGLLL